MDTHSKQLCKLIQEAVIATNEVIASMSRSVSASHDSTTHISDNHKGDEDNASQKVLLIVELLLKASRLSHSLMSRENRTVNLINELSKRLSEQALVIKEQSTTAIVKRNSQKDAETMTEIFELPSNTKEPHVGQ